MKLLNWWETHSHFFYIEDIEFRKISTSAGTFFLIRPFEIFQMWLFFLTSCNCFKSIRQMNEEPFVWSGPLLSLFSLINYRYRYWHLLLFDHLGAGCALDATTRGLKTAMVELGRVGLKICAWFLVSYKSLYYVPVFQIRIQSGQWIRSSRAKMTHKNRISKEISCFEVLNVLFWGLMAFPVAWTSLTEAFFYFWSSKS